MIERTAALAKEIVEEWHGLNAPLLVKDLDGLLSAHLADLNALRELLAESFEALGGCDGQVELRGRILAALSPRTNSATNGERG